MSTPKFSGTTRASCCEFEELDAKRGHTTLPQAARIARKKSTRSVMHNFKVDLRQYSVAMWKVAVHIFPVKGILWTT